MNFSTQVRCRNRSGIQTSQLISRNNKVVDSIALGKVSENLNRFLSGHSRRNFNNSSRKFRLNEYFTKDLKAKTSSTHHFLCGPLNTKRLTKKTITGNFDEPISAQPLTLSINDLYNLKQINAKPPWIEEPTPERRTLAINQEKLPESVNSFKFNPGFNDNLSHDAASVGEHNLQDGEVPDLMHVDLQDSCPLYDSCEYEQCPSPIYVQKDTSDDGKSEPDISRYNFFVGGSSDEKFPVNVWVSDSLMCIRNDDKKSNRIINDMKRRKLLTREEMFVSLITWPNDDVDEIDFFFSMDNSAAR